MNNIVQTWLMVSALFLALVLPHETVMAGEPRQILREFQVTGDDAARIISIFSLIDSERLPSSPFIRRLREGLVKRADPVEIAAALEHRLEMYIEARRILQRADDGRRRRSAVPQGLGVLASALESGIPAQIFEDLFPEGWGVMSHRVAAIVEAGETLHLAGVELADVSIFMSDCIKRNLSRTETFRAARFWLRLHREDKDGNEIRRLLWRSADDDEREGSAGRRNSRRNGRGPAQVQD